ncbi:hypothetical protein Barb6_03580 [Bacteroidales bacterium Barb6]|nr:hypothetical protein Barb6_03580 [Bacteroidales bacterium Barb6]
MGVHRLGGYAFTVVAVAFGHLPVTGEGFGISAVDGVEGVFLQCAVQGDGGLQAFHIARCAEVGGKSVDAEGDAVGLLVGIVGRAVGFDAPIGSAVFGINEMRKPRLRTVGKLLVAFIFEKTVSGGERPKDTGVQYQPLLGIRLGRTVKKQCTVETS